MNYAALTLSIN